MSIQRIDGLGIASSESIYAGEVVDLSVIHYRRPNGLVVRREVIAQRRLHAPSLPTEQHVNSPIAKARAPPRSPECVF